MIKEDFLAELRTLIAFESVPDHPEQKHECIDYCIHAYIKQGEGELHKGEYQRSPYVYLEHPAPELLWFAHIDVIPAEKSEFSLRIEKDTVFGRGVCDMKGNALAFLLAYRDLLREGRLPKVSILLTSDEEIGGATIPHLLDEGVVKAPVAFTPDAGGDTEVVIGHKGVAWLELIAKGKGGHSARPFAAQNPVPLLAKAISKIAEVFPEGSKDDWKTTVTPTMLKSSDAANKIPEVATATLDVRFTPEEYASAEQAIDAVQACLPEGCSVEAKFISNPLHTDASHPMVQRFLRISEDVLGSIKTGRGHGASDARYFGDRGIPAFLNSPRGGNLHSPDEWASIKSLLEQYEINKRVLKELC